MKYIEKYLKDIIKVKPLGKLTTEEDELDGISGEMVYIDGKCSNIFISHIDYANWLEKQGENNKSLYIRFGDIPKNEKSKVYNGEIEIGTEKGVSVYPAFEDSEGNIVLGLSLPVTKTSLYTQQHLLEYDNRACYLVSGDYVGKGTDGEPLLRNIKIIREIKDFRVKQGEQKPNYCHHEVDLSECSEEYRKAYYDGWNNCNMQHSQCKSELDDVVKCLINGMKFYYEDNEEATWGTDKWSMPVKHIIEVLEKQGENKYADKVEPKFHKGDWITNGDYTWKIVQVKPLDYILQSQDGNIVDDTISHVDEQFHSFTIQDAKEGDVLALSYAFQNYILIYKGLHEKDFDTMMSVFCSYYVEENTYEDETDSFHAMNRGEIITPATKKQRDILIKAMNGAGYTFDFETKELKKLGQPEVTKTSDQEEMAEIPFGAKDSELQEATYFIPKGFHAEIDDDKVVIKKGEKSAAWSKKDEKMFKYALNMIEWYSGKNEDKSRYVSDWLKSLKQRIGG